ncbi:TonB-dependent receptor plug domain-containing protein [Sphingobium nicotianae]|uniref:TonB-dependent receptor n=1 Tax=Sphingobium nicotianae TaxID=2782607 RepID=A0A9X1IT03_9SPHN|nr:TonB-dependent receptor [Sphingobium nicotianae]MBT2189073.1 TonB-dependent receptor [Sphingobium nicotianae]
MTSTSSKTVFPGRGWKPAHRRTGLAATLACASALVAPLDPSIAVPTTSGTPDTQAPSDQDGDTPQLLDLSLDQLMNIEVTSVSKRPESLGGAAAAVYVITQEDIRRSGMSSVPELLRMVPGLQVARFSAHDWAIGARGYDVAFPGKMLVLVDGRSVYTPVLSAVLWDLHELPLQDIERIEVIRGPGATIWGANAVDGVINIITRNARDTPGLVASASGGTSDDGTVAVSYGGKLSDSAFYRVYGKILNRAALRTSTGGDAGDSWRQTRGGVRLDWTPSAADTLSMNAEYYDERANSLALFPNLTGPIVATPQVQINRGGHLLANWNHRFSPASDLTAQGYYDKVHTQFINADVRFDTYDVELRHHVVLGMRHDLVWGGGYRRITYDSRATQVISVSPPSGGETVYNLFTQDDFALTGRLHLIAGLKLEHNSYTGWENEPTLRLRWSIAPDHTVWAAVSKAVRTPSFGDEFARANLAVTPASPTAPPALIAVFGNPGAVDAERLTSWQVGYRGAIEDNLAIDASGFYNRYTKAQSVTTGTPFLESSPPPTHLVVPLVYRNQAAGELYGMELAIRWQILRTWQLFGAYSLNLGDIRPVDPSAALLVGRGPHHGFQIRSQLDLPGRTEFDAAIYYASEYQVGDFDLANSASTAIPAYVRLDLRFGWWASDHLSFSLSGENLLQSRHPESSPTLSVQTEVPRTVNLTATARF